jgi:hypothetical protein
MRDRRDAVGSGLGLITFLGGVVLLLLTFSWAYRMFNTPPGEALGLREGEAIDFGLAGSTFVVLILRVLLLIAMGVIGSLLANRGIHLYTMSRGLSVRQERVRERAVSPEEPENPAP